MRQKDTEMVPSVQSTRLDEQDAPRNGKSNCAACVQGAFGETHMAP